MITTERIESKPKKAEKKAKSSQTPILDGYVNSTAEHWVYSNIFESGEGDWAVLDSTFYHYSCGCWHLVENKVIDQQVYESTLKLYTLTKEGERRYKYATHATAKSCVEFCRNILPPRVLPEGSEYLRVFRNCTLNMATGEQLPHRREHYAVVAIDADYVPNAECPKEFRDFIEKCYGLDLLPLIRACMNMCINPSAAWHLFISLVGASRSGKGTLIRFLQSLFGETNTASCGNLSEISSPEKRHQTMTGVSLLAFPDMAGMVRNVTDFYELVDNGAMQGRALYSSSAYRKKWHTRFVIGSVLPLRVENSNEGWDKRCILIPTLSKVLHDPYIDERLAQPEIKSAVISWALAMDAGERDSLLQDSTKASERIAEAKHNAMVDNDPVKAFIDHCLRPCPGAGKIKSAQLHTWYTAYAKAFGYSDMGEKFFASRLKQSIEDHYVARRKAKKSDNETPDQEHGMIGAGWIDLEILPGLFEISLGETICNKNRSEEGGLTAFEYFAESKKELQEVQESDPEPGVVEPIQLEIQGSHEQEVSEKNGEPEVLEEQPFLTGSEGLGLVASGNGNGNGKGRTPPLSLQHGQLVIDTVTRSQALFDEMLGDRYCLIVDGKSVIRCADEILLEL